MKIPELKSEIAISSSGSGLYQFTWCNAMKERPIIFGAEMVRAILDGNKTQTRRVLKQQPVDILPMKIPDRWVCLIKRGPNRGQVIKCRFGEAGDLLWVRETWATLPHYNHLPPREIPDFAEIAYKADGLGRLHGKTRSPIHMPRWASRITLEIIGVKVERVQDISNTDCFSEGIDKASFSGRTAFMIAWEIINRKRGYSWESNPWVWVIEFERAKS